MGQVALNPDLSGMPRLRNEGKTCYYGQQGTSQNEKINVLQFKAICLLLSIYAASTGWETCTYEGRLCGYDCLIPMTDTIALADSVFQLVFDN